MIPDSNPPPASPSPFIWFESGIMKGSREGSRR